MASDPNSPSSEDTGHAPEALPELLFLATLFGIVMFVTAAWLYVI